MHWLFFLPSSYLVFKIVDIFTQSCVLFSSSANATPEFEGRGGEELATEISSMLSRAYECPSCLNLKKLAVVDGKQCWVIYVDVLVSLFVMPT